jgi:hypothetical protein
MKANEIFESRISAIHGLSEGNEIMNVRHEEFMAMADAFLGADFDRAKLARVEALQLALHEAQLKLSGQMSARQIERMEYVDAVNELHSRIAQQCAAVLGRPNFLKLFGVSPAEAGAYIDREQFLAQA